jgi:phosphonatase-like hydrolase
MKLTRRQSLPRFAVAGSVPWMATAAARVSRPPIRLVVLDIGGTIVEDRGDVPALLRSAMEHHGVPSSPEEIARMRGASKREVIGHFVDSKPVPASGRDRLIDAIHAEFTAKLIEVYRSVPPVAGAEGAIRRLRAAGYLVATTTGFDRAVTASIFRRLGWEQYFAATICADDVTQGRPAPYMLFHAMEAARVNSVAEVAAVGDTPLDLQAGNNGGVRAVVGVLSGAGKEAQLRAEPHTRILPSVAQLPGLLPEL